MKDPVFKKEYDNLEPEFQLINAIVKQRIVKGITQKQLAEKVGTRQSSIARFESGTYNPTLAFVKKLTDVLGVKIYIV